MIIDSLTNTARYECIHPSFKLVFDYFKTQNPENLPLGKILLEGDCNPVINISEVSLKSKENASLEAHNKHIDIQIPISSAEFFGWKSRNNCSRTTIPFDPEKDIEFYADDPTVCFTLHPGEFVIFFPDDAHAPCIGQGDIKKIVVKIDVI